MTQSNGSVCKITSLMRNNYFLFYRYMLSQVGTIHSCPILYITRFNNLIILYFIHFYILLLLLLHVLYYYMLQAHQVSGNQSELCYNSYRQPRRKSTASILLSSSWSVFHLITKAFTAVFI